MSVEVKKFGELNGVEVNSYTLANNNGFVAEILNYGGIVKRLVYKGVDTVLGRDTLEEYLENNGCFSALIGRNSNRIENSEFELNGKIYKLYANNGRNNLHGGKIGFDKKVWAAEVLDGVEPSLKLSLSSPDGEEGFPGNAEVTVTYTVKNDNSLEIRYLGECDADTVFNMTNHAYFNLNGHSSGKTDDHTLWLDCDFYTPNNDECIPTGEVLSVKNTPFDFSKGAKMGDGYSSSHPQIALFGGYDHNFALNGRGYRKVGVFEGDKTGIKMEIYTDQSAVQIYSGNMIQEGRVCKDGALYEIHGGVCFETQAFPNSLKFSHFPGAILKKGEKYDTVTSYKFI
ncbi:MAG: galactose mutarotase [Ruminococcaceae bacterium]|nr:galactose mutarotase [Oscillospiraceae bacterium]